AYIAGRWGDNVIDPLYKSVLAKGWRQGFVDVLGISLDSLSDDWQTAMREQFTPDTNMQKPQQVGKQIIGEDGQTNLSPVISPDGKYVAFLSNRDLFTLDLYLADAQTGEIIKKLVTSNTDEHFDALRFMNSSGTWSPDAKTLAFPVFKKGDNYITFLDVETQKVKRTVKVAPLEAITYLAWSPDGKNLLISGTSGAINDLYIYDIASGENTQITNDRYAEIQPTWSPDGKKIAFSTDRGPQTDFDSLTFGPMKLGFYDFETKKVRLLSMTEKAKHITPQFSPDGKSIYFVSDPDGISNLYRYEFDSGTYYRITNVATGVSGLTELSPAFSLASNTGEGLVSIFQETDYRLHRIAADSADGEPYDPSEADYLATTEFSPGEPTIVNLVNPYLEKSTAPQLDPGNFSVSDYTPNLDLLYVGQAYVGGSISGYGSGIAGGLSMLFSDLLGNHLLGVAAQVSGSIEDLGGQIQYLNQSKRINWGLGAGHSSYLTADSIYYEPAPGDPDAMQRSIIFRRTFVDQLSLMADYPFSTNRRLETGVGFTRYSFQKFADILTYRGTSILDQEEENRSDPDALNQFTSSLAYVGDYSVMGFTGPVNGRRFRIQAEPTFGTLRYASILADYRHYFFLHPLTFAVRLLHYGRYLKDAENSQLSEMTIGYETLVRGYSVYSFSGDTDEDDALDKIYGSRIGVVNAELRVPLLGTEQFGLIDFQYLPTTLVGFFDAGVAWNKGDYPVLRYNDDLEERVPVFSAGIGARVNLLGVLILQFTYAYPFQRPKKGAHFSFAITPGW
ncbi:MAG: BamA/TamA family outer membrane protein, partial [Fibrobacterota bacterium]